MARIDYDVDVSSKNQDVSNQISVARSGSEAGASEASFSKNPRKRSVREASVIYTYNFIYIYIYIAFIFKKICRKTN